MKLNKSNLLETLKRLNNGATAYQARKVAHISVRRFYQIKQIYEATGELPEIGKKAGRPMKIIEQWEIDIVKESYQKYRVSADTLERIIDRDYERHIAHNRIHKILIELGFLENNALNVEKD